MEDFRLIPGCSVENISGVENGYTKIDDENYLCSVSGEKLPELAAGALDILREPIFFFAEVPCTEDEEKSLGEGLHKGIYYLDNCTREVAFAITERYGGLLFSDGLLQFGFGSHENDSEIYFRKFQTVNFHSCDASECEKFEKVLEKAGLPHRGNDLKTLWDAVSQDNPGERSAVEYDGETIYDMIDNLTDAGLYRYSIVQDE